MQQGDSTAVLEWTAESLEGAHMPSRCFIAAAVCCGFQLAGPLAVHDVLDGGAADLEQFRESLAIPGMVRRRIRVAFKTDPRATFILPDGSSETLSVYEFRARFESDLWAAQNPEHPLAYLRGFLNHLSAVNLRLKGGLPHIKLTRGSREVYLLQDGDAKYSEERTREILGFFVNGWESESVGS